ncbi:MAG TPA: response regulator [Polyangiaceae bacterium]|jgi:CheY-like chemotaxis protein|nr:response regulator [Polyangiaceae bacterium]
MTAAKPPTTVLVVDDDEDIRLAMYDTLEAEGYQVLLAEDGQDALTKLRSASEPPSLILLDLMMPNLDGSGFCAEQQGDPGLAGIPVVIVSADSHVKQKAAALGVAGSLVKPVRIADLLATIERFSHAP